MHFSSALLSALALAPAAYATCFRYSCRIYGLENPERPGVYVDMAITNGDISETYCTLQLGRDEYMNHGNVEFFTFDCPPNGWFATLHEGSDFIRITTPDSDKEGKYIDAPIDWDSSDAGNGVGFLLSYDGSNGC